MAVILDYLWAFSLVSKSTLQNTAAYQITAWTPQSDQVTPGLGWKEPQRKNTKRPRPARIAGYADLGRKADGFSVNAWSFPPWTPGQYLYLINNQWSTGALWSAPATIQTWDESVNDWACFQCIAWRPVPGEDYDILDTFLTDPVIRFTKGVRL